MVDPEASFLPGRFWNHHLGACFRCIIFTSTAKYIIKTIRNTNTVKPIKKNELLAIDNGE